MAKKVYVVFSGKEPGIYQTWAECQEQTKGVKGAKFKSFEDESVAKREFDAFIHQDEMSQEEIDNSISTDVSCLGNPGQMEYRVVKTKDGEELFHSPIYSLGTNNIGEFLGVVEAMKYVANHNQMDTIIFTDSITALSWVKSKKPKTVLEISEKTEALFRELKTAISWLESIDVSTFKIMKWETHIHGEIKSDFGRKTPR